MSDFQTRLVSRLKADNAVKAITTKVYPNAIPEGIAAPYIVYSLSLRPLQTASGRDSKNTMFGQLICDCVDATYEGACALARAVRASLSGWRSTGDSVYGVTPGAWSEDSGPESEGSKIYLFKITQPFDLDLVEA